MKISLIVFLCKKH